jgi:phosphoglycolate phosphatase
MYQLLIFDWDGTLMDSAQKIANCIKASAGDLNIPVPTEQAAKRIIGLGLDEAMRKLFPEVAAQQIPRLVERYRINWLEKDTTNQELFPGVRDGLRELAASGAFLAVATGKSRQGLQRQLDDLDLGELFAVTRCADETRSKPHPQMLAEILDYTAISPHKAIMVGDTTYDLEMASNADIVSIGAGYGVHQHDELAAQGALAVMQSFNEILSWFQQDRVEPAFQEMTTKKVL